MNPILLNLGFIQIRWYSVLILLGFVIGYFLVISRCKKKGIPISIISDMCFYLVIVCILGARAYYCLFKLNEYESIIDMFKIWEGGLAIHGGIIAGFIFIYFYTKKKKINLLEILDIFAPALALGQAIGRWGNFFNGEAFGRPIELSVLKNFHLPQFIYDGVINILYIPNFMMDGILNKFQMPQFIIDGMYLWENGTYDYRTPTFFYESIGCLIIFIILIIIRNKDKIKNGQVVSIYLILYGIIRFLIEGLRTDSLMFFNLRIAQIVSGIMILIGLYLFIRPYIKKKVKNS